MKWIMRDCSHRSRHDLWFNLLRFKVYYIARATGVLYPEDDMIEMEVGLYWLDKQGRERWIIKPNWVR